MLTFTILHLNVLILAAMTFYQLCDTLDVLSVIYCNDCRHLTAACSFCFMIQFVNSVGR